MKAIETTATINDKGQLDLDLPLNLIPHRRVRIIVLVPEEGEMDEKLESDPDDEPIDRVVEGIREGWQQALTGKTYPVSQLWDGLDVE
ncbi:type II toxin-antitoxin system RelN family antitoxin [Egbenema bharatensis]|uniref:type II toxin-antitoxin system RelN family antitoxin n=1 Tax=Egbenema bharatensis TaxID=3463334 RepID=UPI003A8696DA